MEVSKKLLWVYVDRDVTPEIPKRFTVSAYPTLIVLGAKQEKIHRFSGYREADPFKKELEKSLAKHELYRAGKEWDTPEPRPEKICDEGTIATLKAPSDEVPSGISFLGEHLWVAQSRKLYQLDPKTGGIVKQFDLPEGIQDLATDGKDLYALTFGWSAGLPIYVLDPATGQEKRSIVTASNKGKRAYSSRGIEFCDGKLYVLDINGTINEVDAESGEIKSTLRSSDPWVFSLAYDGKNFVCGTRTHLVFLDPKTGKVAQKIAMNYPLRAVGYHDGTYYLMEQPIFDFDKDNKSIRLWPKETKIHAFKLGTEY